MGIKISVGDNPHSFGTVNWYKYEIRHMTEKANERFYQYDQVDFKPPQLENWENRLLAYSGKPNPFKKKDTLGLGFSGKRKNVIIRQYKELKHFLDTDFFTTQGQEFYSEREKDAYEAFKSNNILDWEYEKWKRMVDTFGNIDQEILNSFGYEDHSSHKGSKTALVVNNTETDTVSNSSLVNAYSYAYDNEIDILTLMNEVDKELHGAGADPKKALDLLWDKIRESIKVKENVDD